MDVKFLRAEINRQYGQLILQARTSANRPLKLAARMAGLTIEEFLMTERHPADVPACILFKAIGSLGHEASADAQVINLNLSLVAFKLRSPRR